MSEKECKYCKETKAVSEFPKGKGYKDGIRPYCIPCRQDYERKSFHKNKHKRPYDYLADKDRKLQKAFGISYQEYLKMLEAQQGACAICGTTDTGKRKAFAVDHCHDTGKIRGLLCSNCNTGIGNLRDNIKLLERAIEYLRNSN
jgi:hypothetical protein